MGRVGEALTRKREEGALLESEAKCRELFDGAPVAYHELDKDGVMRRVSRAECAHRGRNPRFSPCFTWAANPHAASTRRETSIRAADLVLAGQAWNPLGSAEAEAQVYYTIAEHETRSFRFGTFRVEQHRVPAALRRCPPKRPSAGKTGKRNTDWN